VETRELKKKNPGRIKYGENRQLEKGEAILFLCGRGKGGEKGKSAGDNSFSKRPLRNLEI